jgi:serine/threonine-protein kinase
MGRLYIAEQTGIEGFAKIVALKSILPHLADSPHFRSMFLNEARVAARLEHPNIVTTYELGEVGGTYFIAMEYLPGEDLGALLARCQPGKPMPVEIAAALAQQSANGLHYAHEMRDPEGKPVGLVHRDVNPANIYVTYYGMVKLLDFGVVKGPSSNKTSPGVFKGKYAYGAPEQVQGDPIDRRTDLFCLGIVLWECLTGQRLFGGNSDAAMIDAVRTKKIAPPSALRPDVPAELDEITMRALARDRSQRYQTAFEMSEALDRFLGKRPQRPTSKSIGQLIESLFGAERAALKKALAQGSEVESALARLAATGGGKVAGSESPGSVRSLAAVRPRALWSTDVGLTGAGVRRIEPPRPRAAEGTIEGRAAPIALVPRPGTAGGAPALRGTGGSVAAARPVTSAGENRHNQRTVVSEVAPTKTGSRAIKVVAAVAALAAIGVVGLSFRGGSRPKPVAQEGAAAIVGALELQSEPPGAHISVDGEPSGLVTPAVLRGLRAGRAVEIKLDRAGFQPVVQKLDVVAGQTRLHLYRLAESAGTVRFEGVPPKGRVYLDDVEVNTEQPITAAVGERKLRVEAEDGVVVSQSIDVQPGEQTIRIRPNRRGP